MGPTAPRKLGAPLLRAPTALTRSGLRVRGPHPGRLQRRQRPEQQEQRAPGRRAHRGRRAGLGARSSHSAAIAACKFLARAGPFRPRERVPPSAWSSCPRARVGNALGRIRCAPDSKPRACC